MDDTDDDARYPPNPYTSNLHQNFASSHRPKLPVRNPSFPPPIRNGFADQEDDEEEEDEDDEEEEEENDEAGGKTLLAREESKLEKEIIRIILTGNTDSLKPNSGQAVTISGEHHVCVGYHVEAGSDYRVWEWHGHIMLFDEENGYNPEYIYGNYFERVQIKGDDEKGEAREKEVGNLGLRELIGEGVGNGDSSNSRILRRRNMSAGSPR
eukprot:TRINITY_DN961_c0_g4_i2.p1 TRINITY_DN961_c0_g4~~TRINITY_DN961_c0_g4_i2.p1  ORF type:complete len:210 (-),score=39.73 TRINITY_DN961_c0_g4_i2:200-829(-)